MIKLSEIGIVEDAWCQNSDLREICSNIWYRDELGNMVPRMWTERACDNLIISIQEAETEFESMRKEFGLDGCNWPAAYRLMFLSVFSNLVYGVENACLGGVMADEYLADLEQASRTAHIFTIKNLRKSYYLSAAVKDDEKYDISDEVVCATGFMLQCRIWKVTLKDGSWCLAFDSGNGNYIRVSKINDYELITENLK